ncbi:MAG TPA: YceK/YidQ family lipoprotein [Planctomycetota bacterium]|jgi:uncharacterized protein YceK|nr:YceK/YidQ family lipoprotein [Planctomycetota bacterium]
MSFCALYVLLLLGALVLCIPACSTLGTLSSGDSYLYSGTRANITNLGPAQDDSPFRDLARCISIFDFPFSLVVDSALIPFTLPMQVIVGDKAQSPMRPPLEKNPDDSK